VACRSDAAVFVILFIAGLGGCGFLYAGDARELVSEGNRLCEEKRYEEAIAAYEKASVDEPESPEIYYNKGDAYYLKGDYQKASEALEKAGLLARDLELEAKCMYNLGNCAFREAERQKDSDIKKAVDAFQKSIGYYQQALKLNPDMDDAKHNIEVTRIVMKDLLDKLKEQQKQQQEQQKQARETADKIKQLMEKQTEMLTKNRELSEEKEQEGSSEELKEKMQDLAEEQKANAEETRKLSEELNKTLQQAAQSGQQSPFEKTKEHLDNSADEQEGAEEELRKEKLKDAEAGQEKALEYLKKALESMEQESPGGQQGKSDRGQDNEKTESESEEPQQGDNEGQEDKENAGVPAADTARDILDEEKENREYRKLQRPWGQLPVDKDW